jgi:hypothetical protein
MHRKYGEVLTVVDLFTVLLFKATAALQSEAHTSFADE